MAFQVANWLGVRWWYFSQAIIFNDAPSGVSGIRSSAQAVSGRWWQALGDILVFGIFAFLPGPLVGAILMLLRKTTVEFANAFSSILFALTVPVAVVGFTMAYRLYQRRRAQVPSTAPVDVPVIGVETTPA
jgi:hypothetical protein